MRLSKEELDDLLRRNPDLIVDSDAKTKTILVKTKEFNQAVRKAERSKYHAIRTEYNGITYDSKAEARFAQELDLKVKAGQIKYWLRQIPFYLPAGIVYRCDFMVVHEDPAGEQGQWVQYFDVKGMDTPVSKLKRKQVEALYPVKIQVVK